MRQKHLESALSSVQREFPNPDVTLEQYPTSPQLTAAVVLAALERDDVGPGISVCDLGCGTAMLSLGCALVDTDFVFGVDCDAAALERARANIEELELDDTICLIQARVGKDHGNTRGKNKKAKGDGRIRKGGGGRGGRGRQSGRSQKSTSHASSSAIETEDDGDWIFPLVDDCVDTVLSNPPFGTKPDKAGIDVKFLKLGCQIARRAVYSFHKSATRDYVLRTINALPKVKDAAVIAEMKFDLPRTYKFHSVASVDVEVDLIRVQLECDGADDDDDGESVVSDSEIENNCENDNSDEGT